MGPRFWLRIVPACASAIAATVAGMSLGSRFAGREVLIASLAAALVCFVAAMTFPRTGAWSIALLLGMSLSVGVALAMLAAPGPSSPVPAVASSILVLSLSAVVGRLFSSLLRPAYRPLWWLAIALLVLAASFNLALAAMGGAGLPGLWLSRWAVAWGALFVFLSAAWFAGLGGDPPGAAALHLYLLWLNLFLVWTWLMGQR